jgi:LmbE family N-acetylglucosaminyl deacetylase
MMKESDDRFKADLLLVVAHPDDETAVGPYLAKAVYDDGRRVAVVFTTHGESGGNQMGLQHGAALGAIREMEARQALASFGVTNVWFLNGCDTPGEDALRSLARWGHASALEQTVRLIRLTRPEIILTWLPACVVGEHGDHQAAGIVTTEAFDLAGDPAAFPSQIAVAATGAELGADLVEGLRPWQPKKLYFFSDPLHLDLTGRGPRYSITEISDAHQVPYYWLATQEASFHLTQETGQVTRDALAGGDESRIPTYAAGGAACELFPDPARIVLGKSLVGGSPTSDVFEGIRPGTIPFEAVRRNRPQGASGIALELGGPWHFYREFWDAHGIEHVGQFVEPELSIPTGGPPVLSIPLILRNRTAEAQDVIVRLALPEGWTHPGGALRLLVPARDAFTFQADALLPDDRREGWQRVTCMAEVKGKAIGSASLQVSLRD